MNKDYFLSQTRIQVVGAKRCCLERIGTEFKGKRVKFGDKSICSQCLTGFTLTTLADKEQPGWMSEEDWKRPHWVPDRQIELNAQDKAAFETKRREALAGVRK